MTPVEPLPTTPTPLYRGGVVGVGVSGSLKVGALMTAKRPILANCNTGRKRDA